ncbi:hypothetical protein BDZ45DRAFT_272798 [Acephala macrosclerotiorum]|nr:hypothetical protein BDZ45DRAFT_272798 [Acephala macrosclerotiorum]
MAPKHGLAGLQSEEQAAKRAKSSATPASRSATPADTSAKVPFKVEYPNMNTSSPTHKQKQLIDAADFQVSPFTAKGASKEGELDQYYTVTPTTEWEDMKKYNNFIIQGEVYKNNQFVFVRGEDTPKDKDTEGRPKDFWVARILQVRAKNAQHVYALVAWMYWAEELPAPAVKAPDQLTKESGKRRYHGSHELIASNYMDVLDVLSFAGKAEVHHWLEEDDNLQHKLYWRQTFCRETQALSKLRQHCICKGYFNPEVTMYICDNSSCKIWLHDDHLIDDILMKTYKKQNSNDGTNGVAKVNGKKMKTPPYKGIFKATIREENDKPPVALITDLRANADPKTWEERIACPKCDELLQ